MKLYRITNTVTTHVGNVQVKGTETRFAGTKRDARTARNELDAAGQGSSAVVYLVEFKPTKAGILKALAGEFNSFWRID